VNATDSSHVKLPKPFSRLVHGLCETGEPSPHPSNQPENEEDDDGFGDFEESDAFQPTEEQPPAPLPPPPPEEEAQTPVQLDSEQQLDFATNNRNAWSKLTVQAGLVNGGPKSADTDRLEAAALDQFHRRQQQHRHQQDTQPHMSQGEGDAYSNGIPFPSSTDESFAALFREPAAK